ncbi:Uma2 family endonuclease [Niabella ginsengisoli]|uniref:Uma2 family endonuclease n=1 Tax=Niabella ginsengisoli TaxID=522298 RepID=A0ABS9SJA9_9BACT|nr:Uma2 family endonuclease [Niabella ginsengisoli]MCH5598449.1 Uma2 family endonuclease [Niabella ginsengisoli]
MSKIVTDINELNLNGTYTYADYLLWRFKERVELFKGKIFKMSPAPNVSHQKVSLALTRNLDKVFHQSDCQLFVAPFDVRLVNYKQSKEDEQIHTVVQPDLCVICDENKIDTRGCVGAPDLIIEILSPGNTRKEMNIKFDLYQENGVLEYWMVDVTDRAIFMYVLENGKYIGLKPFSEESMVQSNVFPQLHFAVNNIF